MRCFIAAVGIVPQLWPLAVLGYPYIWFFIPWSVICGFFNLAIVRIARTLQGFEGEELDFETWLNENEVQQSSERETLLFGVLGMFLLPCQYLSMMGAIKKANPAAEYTVGVPFAFSEVDMHDFFVKQAQALEYDAVGYFLL